MLPSHYVKGCRASPKCGVENCGKRHYTILHGVFDKAEPEMRAGGESPVAVSSSGGSDEENEVKNNSISTTSSLCSLYVPVFLSSKSNPTKEVKVTAMLDVQSDTSFVLEDTADLLPAPSQRVFLNLTTLTSSNLSVECNKYEDLQVRAIDSNEYITLPEAYSRQRICEKVGQIPSRSMVNDLPRLRELAPQFEEQPITTVALLVGANVADALKPIEVKDGGGHCQSNRQEHCSLPLLQPQLIAFRRFPYWHCSNIRW